MRRLIKNVKKARHTRFNIVYNEIRGESTDAD